MERQTPIRGDRFVKGQHGVPHLLYPGFPIGCIRNSGEDVGQLLVVEQSEVRPSTDAPPCRADNPMRREIQRGSRVVSPARSEFSPLNPEIGA